MRLLVLAALLALAAAGGVEVTKVEEVTGVPGVRAERFAIKDANNHVVGTIQHFETRSSSSGSARPAAIVVLGRRGGMGLTADTGRLSQFLQQQLSALDQMALSQLAAVRSSTPGGSVAVLCRKRMAALLAAAAAAAQQGTEQSAALAEQQQAMLFGGEVEEQQELEVHHKHEHKHEKSHDSTEDSAGSAEVPGWPHWQHHMGHDHHEEHGEEHREEGEHGGWGPHPHGPHPPFDPEHGHWPHPHGPHPPFGPDRPYPHLPWWRRHHHDEHEGREHRHGWHWPWSHHHHDEHEHRHWHWPWGHHCHHHGEHEGKEHGHGWHWPWSHHHHHEHEHEHDHRHHEHHEHHRHWHGDKEEAQQAEAQAVAQGVPQGMLLPGGGSLAMMSLKDLLSSVVQRQQQQQQARDTPVARPAAGVAADSLAGRPWTGLQNSAVPAPEDDPLDWSLWGEDGSLNWGALVFFCLTLACGLVWLSLLASCLRCSSRSRCCRRAPPAQFVLSKGESSSDVLAPLLPEGPIKGAVEYAADHSVSQPVSVIAYVPVSTKGKQ